MSNRRVPESSQGLFARVLLIESAVGAALLIRRLLSLFCYRYVPKAFKSLEANAHPASKKMSGASRMASSNHCSFSISSTFYTVVLTSFPIKSRTVQFKLQADHETTKAHQVDHLRLHRLLERKYHSGLHRFIRGALHVITGHTSP